MKSDSKHSKNDTGQGFSLVEVTLALGLVSFGLIVLFGLLPTGLNLVRESADEGVAVNILTMVAADLESVQPGAATSPRFGIRFEEGEASGLLGGGTALYFDENGMWLTNSADVSRANYLASYDIRARNATTPPNALVMVSWPAQATNPVGNVEALVVLPEDPQ